MTKAVGREAGLFGQPRGIGWLIFAEGWYNVAFYGMRVLLVLTMTQAVLRPGHAAHVPGLAPIRSAFEASYGPLGIAGLAAAIFGLFSSLAYLTPLAGALVADRWLGRTPTILAGGVLIVGANLLLIVEQGFVIALAMMLAGIGCFGGNLTAQLGELYARDDPRRGDGFQLYYLSVDAGVIAAPLVCGTLGEVWGFGYGFAAAAAAMLVALGGYLAGLRSFPHPASRREDAPAERPPVGPRGWRAIAVLLALVPVIGAAAVANNQIYGAYELWGAAHYDLVFFGRRMPVTWLISIDAFISFGCGFAVLALWRWWERRGTLPSEIARCALGAFLSAGATLLLAAAAHAAHGHRIGLGWALDFHLVNNLGVAMLFPLTLALYSRAAPAGLAATMINASKLNFFISFAIVGRLGGLIDRIDGTRFWLIHAAIVAAAGAVLLVSGWLFGGVLAPEDGGGAAPRDGSGDAM